MDKFLLLIVSGQALCLRQNLICILIKNCFGILQILCCTIKLQINLHALSVPPKFPRISRIHPE